MRRKIVYIETRNKNLPDSGAWGIHKFGTASGEQRIALEGNCETDPYLFDFYIKNVDFYFFTKSDMLDYIASIQEEINYPTQNYTCDDYRTFFSDKFKEILSYPTDFFILHFNKNPRVGGTAYLASISNADGNNYNLLRSICLSSEKPGRNNAYTTLYFIKYQDVFSGKYYINLKPIFSKKYSMEELANILKRELALSTNKDVTLNIFGLKYADKIISNSYDINNIAMLAECTDLSDKLSTIISVFSKLKEEQITINPLDNKLGMLGEYIETHPSLQPIFPLDLPLQQIYYGAPGTGKSHKIEELIEEHNIDKANNVFRTTFHPDSDYSTFVGAYKPTKEKKLVRNVGGNPVVENGAEVYEDTISYKFIPQSFLKAYTKAWQCPDEPVVLVIEEINRGNCAQIFGDLFQLLDRKNGKSEYPIKADEDLCKYLKEEFGEEFEGIKNDELCLPSNLYIWATMNTSDQSLFPIDSAFKRRWDWKYIPISQGKDKDGKKLTYKIKCNNNEYDWWMFLQKVNAAIDEATNSEDKKLGFFFCKADDGIISTEKFVNKVLFYLYNDVFKDYDKEEATFNFNGTSYSLLKWKDGDKDCYFKFADFFDEEGNGKVEMAQKFLENINVAKEAADDDTNENGDDFATKDKRFSLDGKPAQYLYEIARDVVLNYSKNNPTKSAQDIRDFFVSTFSGVGASHIVETESEYHNRDGQSSQERSSTEITIPTGEKLYVTTQWRAKNEGDNFFLFKDIVNKIGLGVIS